MNDLPAAVLEEYRHGFETDSKFNKVDPDHSCGIVGITKSPAALSRWAPSFNLESHIAVQTNVVLLGSCADEYINKESSP